MTDSDSLRYPFRLAGRMACVLMAMASALATAAQPTADATPAAAWRDAGQLILVITPEWDAPQGELRIFARDASGWHAAAPVVPITVGRNGSAWGLGLHPAQPGGPRKQEGDGRSPAGVFTLGSAFGYADSLATRLDYQGMQASHYCIDVPASPLYNRIVDSREVGEAAVKGSTEPMRRDLHANGDMRYKQGFVIEHNPDHVAGAGSCIFAHLWKAPGEATAGCTAMSEPAMQRLMGWLDPRRHPIFVLLPQSEYERLRSEWALPATGAESR